MGEYFTSIDGNKVRYLDSGRSGKTLLLIHGLGASADRWEFVAPILEKHYRLVIPDLVGFGYSDKPPVDYTPEFFADFIEKFLAKLNIRHTHVMGSSLGGQVSVEFAAANPRAVDRLVLVSSSGIMKHSTPALDAYILAALYPNGDTAREAFGKMSAGGAVNERIVEAFVERMRLPNAKMAFMSTILGLKNAEVLTAKLEAIASPSLVIWGSLDPVIPIQYADGFVSAIRDCRFHKMDGFGHTPFVDMPDEFARIALDFLSG